MRARTTALVPLRALGAGKSRLAPRLTPEQRASLARAMFRDVIDALRASKVDEVVVAAGDEQVVALASELGLRAALDPPHTPSLDAALAAAAAPITTDALLIVPADLPCLQGHDIDLVVTADAPVVIAATHDGGTAALLRRPPDVMTTAYGPGSARRHHDLAAAAGLPTHSVDAPRLRRDIDTWEDLVGLEHEAVGAHTAVVLPGLVTAA